MQTSPWRNLDTFLNSYLCTSLQIWMVSYAYNKQFLSILSPISLRLKENQPHPRFLQSHITVFPKPRKNSASPANYRPIALLNLDYNHFTNILANRIYAFPIHPTSLSWTELTCPLESLKPRLLSPMLFMTSI